MKAWRWWAISLVLSGCAGTDDTSVEDVDDVDDEEVVAEAASPLCGVSFGVDPRLSLMITEPVDDDDADPLTATERTRLQAVWDAVEPKFSFNRVFSKIRTTSGASSPANNPTLFRRWMDTYNDDANGVFTDVPHCDASTIDPKNFGLECPRTEGNFAASNVNPFTGANATVEPIAIVNRFDLAPKNGASCGEYRIIFSTTSNNVGVGVMLTIFEASLPNPDPASGLAGCAPVADHWHGLSNPALTPTQIASRLEQLYFTGLPGFSPVVTAQNYGLGGGKGQIRTNQLSSQWTLREFKTDVTAGLLSFKPVTSKTNPAEDLFKSTHAQSASFQTNFLNNVKLSSALGASSVATITMSIANAHNSWESNSGGTQYPSAADTAFKNATAAKIASVGSPLTTTQVLRRAQTQSCMGCHQDSAGVALGGGLTWPASLGFVHVGDDGRRSPALVDHFLPRRKVVLESFLASQCDSGAAAAAPPADGLTIGGSAEDAAN